MNIRDIIIGAVAVILIAAAFCLGRACSKKAVESLEIVKVDTLTIRDTIASVCPKQIIITRRDEVKVAVHDTIRLHDTLFVLLEKQQICWRDSLCSVYASGIDPGVDSVIHYTQERVVVRDRVLPAKHWGIGVSVGPAVGYFYTPAGWQPGAGVSAQVGIIYKF